MRKYDIRISALAFVIPILFLWPACARGQAAKAPLSGDGSSRPVFNCGREKRRSPRWPGVPHLHQFQMRPRLWC